MKALREVNFDGIVILDRSPSLQGGGNAQTATVPPVRRASWPVGAPAAGSETANDK